MTEIEKKFRLKKLIKLWEDLGNICINDKDEIEQSFLHFKKGTFREDIWHWFDNELEKVSEYTLFDLMYHKIKY
jgi:hypothetical protein